MRPLVVLALILLVAPALGAQSWHSDPSGLRIRVHNLLGESSPPRGVLPLKVEIYNPDTEKVLSKQFTISVELSGGLSTSSYTQELGEVSLRPGERRKFEVPLPLPFLRSQYPFYQLWVNIGSTSHNFAPEQDVRWMLSCWPDAGSDPSNALVDDARFARSRLPAEDLPERAASLYSVSTVGMRAHQWRGLRPTQTGALLDWLGLGGTLLLWYDHSDEHRARKLSEDLGTVGPWLGRVELIETTDRFHLRAAAAHPPPFNLIWNPEFEVSEEDPRYEPLLHEPDPRWFYALVLIAFAILAGPVTLLQWAAPPRRLRLLWLTPALSLGAVGMLLVSATLWEGGLGTTAVYDRLHLIDPVRGRVTVVHKQIVRAKLLLDSSFGVSGEALLFNAPVFPLEEEDVGASSPSELRRTATLATGNWLRARQVQAHSLTGTYPSTFGLRVSDGDEPEVTSLIPGTLRHLFLRDKEGRLWQCQGLRLGETLPLEPATAQAFAAIFSHTESPTWNCYRSLIEKRAARGTFIAAGELDDPLQPLPTGISFRSGQDLFYGPYTDLP